MSELNEQVTVTVDDTPAITVNTPLVEDFTAENAAPKASAVGAALALKADKSGIMEDVVIDINGETHSDNQGKILLYGDMIPTESGTGKPSLTDAIGAVEAKLYGDEIPMSSGDATKIAAAIAAVDAKTASNIDYVAGTTVKAKIDALEAGMGNMLQKTAQELTTEQKAAVRGNIGLGTAAQYAAANNLTTSTGGEYVLDAAQGYALNNALNNFKNRFNAQNLTGSVTIDNIDSGSQASIVQDTFSVIRCGQMCRIKFNLKFASTQSSTCLALKCDLHNIPLPFAGGARGVSATAGTTTTSIFTYYLQANGTLDIRFIHTGRDGSSSAEYINVIEYMIDDYSGGDDGGEE